MNKPSHNGAKLRRAIVRTVAIAIGLGVVVLCAVRLGDRNAATERSAESQPRKPLEALPSHRSNDIFESHVAQLLHAPAAEITSGDAWRHFHAIVTQESEARAAAQQLIKEHDLSSRLLGHRILLELGEVQMSMEASRRDGSPHIMALLAERLFLSEKFELWDRFVSEVASTITDDALFDLFTAVSQNPPKPELPAGLSLLGLGRRLEPFVEELLNRSEAAVKVARRIILDHGISETERVALFQRLNRAEASGQDKFIEEVIANEQVGQSVRWEALVRVANHASSAQWIGFLTRQQTRTSNEILSEKMDEAAGRVARRIEAGMSELTAQEAALYRQLTASPGSYSPTIRTELRRLLELFLENRSHRPSPDILLLMQKTLIPPIRTYEADRVRSELRFLQWRGSAP